MTIYSPNFNGSVPLADAADNDTPADVLGNKTDTEAGDSVYANLIRPLTDSVDNVHAADVIGSKDDTVGGDSLVALVKIADAAIDVVDAYHDVPAADVADNAVMSDVLGNKTDTEAGDSVYANLIRPLADSADNVHMADVVGSKDDAAAETADVVSVIGLARALVAKSNGGRVTTYPAAAAGTALTAGAANTHGAYGDVSGALAAASRVVSLNFNTPGVAIEPVFWELSYAAGAGVVAEGVIGFGTAVGTYPPINLLGTCGIIPAGATLQVRIQSATGGTTCNVHCSTMPAL